MGHIEKLYTNTKSTPKPKILPAPQKPKNMKAKKDLKK